MEYQLVFSPRLGITPDDFVVAWNEEATTQEFAQARVVPNANQAYNSPVMDIIIFLVSNVGVGLGTNALYDLIKGVIAKKEPKKHIKITQLDQPDGTHLLIFDMEEK